MPKMSFSFWQNAKFAIFGKTPKTQSLEALILGHPQKRILPKMKSPYIRATLFILTYFLFQGILGLPSRSWFALSFFSLISRYSSIFKAFSMVLCKRKRPHRTVFPLYKVFIFSLFYSFPRLKIFAL